MYGVELYAAVRLTVVEEGLSHHEAGRRFGIDRRTVKKTLSYSAPPGYRRRKPVRRPKLDGFTGIVDAILEADADPEVPRKQFPILGPESTLASRAALASRARGLYMSMIAPMACPTLSAAASISLSPRWAYRSVMLTFECPSKRETTGTGTPFITAWLACVWRRS